MKLTAELDSRTLEVTTREVHGRTAIPRIVEAFLDMGLRIGPDWTEFAVLPGYARAAMFFYETCAELTALKVQFTGQRGSNIIRLDNGARLLCVSGKTIEEASRVQGITCQRLWLHSGLSEAVGLRLAVQLRDSAARAIRTPQRFEW